LNRIMVSYPTATPEKGGGGVLILGDGGFG
jgi:hypothetical protein